MPELPPKAIVFGQTYQVVAAWGYGFLHGFHGASQPIEILDGCIGIGAGIGIGQGCRARHRRYGHGSDDIVLTGCLRQKPKRHPKKQKDIIK